MAAGLCVGGALASMVLLSSFRHLEVEAVQQKATQVYRAFTADIEQLAVSNRDYAEWDSASEFVSDGNGQFIASNFTFETLQGMHVDLVRIVGKDGQDLFSGQTNRLRERVDSPADLTLAHSLQPVADAAIGAAHLVTRFVATRAGLAAVTATPITMTDRRGPTGAAMVFARFIDEDTLNRIRQTSQLPATLLFLTHGVDDLMPMPGAVRHWAASPEDTDGKPLVVNIDRGSAAGYALIRGGDGAPLAILTTTTARSIFALGVRTTWFLVVALTLVVGSFGGAAAWLLWRLQRSYATHRAFEMSYRSIVAPFLNNFDSSDRSQTVLARTLPSESSETSRLVTASGR